MPSSRSSNRSELLSRRSLLGALGLGAGAVAFRGRSLLVGCLEREEEADRQEVLRQTVRVVILPSFAALGAEVDALLAAATVLRDAPSLVAIEGTRKAWRDGRATWKRTEAFALGPSDDLQITGGAIDAWPPAADKLEALVAGTDAVDDARAATLPANQRGFSGIEALLFDAAAGEATANQRLLEAPRRRVLLASLTVDLAKKCRALEAAWSGGYGREIAEAGLASKAFPRQREAVDAMVTALLALAEQVLVAKLAKPLGLDTGGPPQPSLEEAARSDFSLASIENAVIGIDAVYMCQRAGQRGESFAAAVRRSSVAADDAMRTAIDETLAQIRSTSAPMRVALGGDRAPIVAVHEKMQALKRAIAGVASALGASLGFGYSDTD